MAQHNSTENKISADKFNMEDDSKGVVNIAKYKQVDDPVNAETSAFEQVMSQMNIAGRNTFDSQFSQFWTEASDSNELLSVLMCEIDFFKAYNDNYGHQGASFMLLVVGLALKNTCEKHGCFLARYKNQEFAILMKGGDEIKVLEVAESLRQAVEASRTEHKYSSVSKIVTLSIGISSIYPTSMKMLMNKADKALNKAQVSGRNQVASNFSVQVKLENTPIEAVINVPVEVAITESVIEPAIVVQDVVVEENVSIEKEEEINQLAFQQTMLDMNISDRREFHPNFVKLWKEAIDEKELLSMLMCEVDFFQAYIDHYGQQPSKDVLLIVASALQDVAIKFNCFVSHVEGEKFIVLSKGGNATQALKVAELIHTAVENSGTEHQFSVASGFVTMSIGLSSIFPSELNSMKALMVEANTALHDATVSGRNQISVH